MKEEYKVLLQRGYEEKNNKWLNGGMCYMSTGCFDTLEEAIKCRDLILSSEENKKGFITSTFVNGIGIEIKYDDNVKEDLKLKRIKIVKRQVTEWEEV